MVSHGEWVAVSPVAELELAFEVSAPEIIGLGTFGQGCSGGAVASLAHAQHEAVPIEHGVDGTLGRDPDIAVEAPDQELADLARAPMRLVALEADDQASRAGSATGWA
jgi:hypothetical protein